jgi:hypothetical protein
MALRVHCQLFVAYATKDWQCLITTKNSIAQSERMGYCRVMPNAASTSALERLLRPLSRELTVDLARALINVQADAEIQSRYDELADKCSAGDLASDEQAELEAIVRANTLLGVLKAEARALLANGKAA